VSRIRSLADRPVVRKLGRYAAASVVGVVTGQALLYLCYSVLEWDAVAANVVSVAVSSIPAYLVNRYWVWQKRGRNSLRAEVIPFWLMAFLGLLLSSVLVAVVEGRTDSALALGLASLSGFGVLWVAKFIVLERVLFAPVAHALDHDATEPHEPAASTSP
jgi:putative flippase GtrA